jgi:hypothetical protein
MTRFYNYLTVWLVGLGFVAAAPSVSAFALLGPTEAWQTSTIGYERFTYITLPASGWVIFGDDFAVHPHNIGEEYRWNNPQLYYAFDQSFLDYFGSNGVAAVDAAMAVFNGLTNVSNYSPDLTEFPLEESRVNYTASALHLYDLKSTVMELMIERLGLIDPDRWTWCIRARVLPPGLSCPQFDFAVIQRNFDPISGLPSRYVNGNLFTYEIQQTCPPPYDFGDAEEFLVDPVGGVRYTALATPKIMLPDENFYGWFHTGFTRDDIGGLRYLYQTNNMNIEGSGTNSVAFVPNTNSTLLLVTSNLTFLAENSLTTNTAGLLSIYPGLQVTSETPFYTNIATTNFVGYLTNSPLDPVGTPPHIFVLKPVATTNVYTYYRHTFGNVITNSYASWGLVTVYTTNITTDPHAPVGSGFVTNLSVVTMATNMVMGDFYIVPSNFCGVKIVGTQLTTTTSITNYFPSTNLYANLLTSSNVFLARYGTTVTYFTNHYLLYNPVECVTNSIALRQGIEKVTFIRREYDSWLGQFFAPVTNNYVLNAVTNGTVIPQQVQRIVTAPDILFSASDLTGGFPSIPTVVRTAPNFDLTGEQPTLAGPGVIRGPVTYQFNKVGPVYLNGTYPLFVDEAGALLNFMWASFDATTNAPVLYPNSLSIANLENQVLIQISPPFLPDAVSGTAYTVQLQSSAATPNWQAPFTWSLAAGSAGLPPGLNLSSTGRISGTPVQPGAYNFVIQATDAASRTARQSYSITVAAHP